ncbi:MAG: GDSL-type esterase/lipase family protein, partial [Bacteroidales bacterium]
FCNQLYPDTSMFFFEHDHGVGLYYHKRIEDFKKDPLKEGDIVFFGGTLVEKGGDWAKRMAMPNIKNRGIDRDVSYAMVARCIEIICAKPKAIIVLVGTDDLWVNNTTTLPSHVTGNIKTIARLTKHYQPETKFYVLSATPGSDSLQNTKIQTLNQQLKAEAKPDLFTFIDLAPKFQDKNHKLLKTVSKDGVLLNEIGYKMLADLLKTSIK